MTYFYFFGKPGLDFNFYKKLKLINPKIVIVYFQGDADVFFPNYVKFLVNDFDFYISNEYCYSGHSFENGLQILMYR